MSPNHTLIEVEGVSLAYNSLKVLDQVNFHVSEGDKLGLAGPNGAGKTTLCHIIMGLLKPDSGSVKILGEERVTEDDFSEIRTRIGFLFQDSDDQLFCPTVLEDVAFGPLNQGKSPDEARDIVDRTLGALGLSGLQDRFTYQLSGGEKRLVALATILAMDPDVLILDEPTTGVDESTVERLVEILNSSDKAHVVISHDRAFLPRVTENILVMRDGKVIFPGQV
jgi:cobalt/nickel transport system ATP-binding protein